MRALNIDIFQPRQDRVIHALASKNVSNEGFQQEQFLSKFKALAGGTSTQ